MTDERSKFLLTLQSLGVADSIRTLRAALKRLLCDYKLRCLSIREESTTTDAKEYIDGQIRT